MKEKGPTAMREIHIKTKTRRKRPFGCTKCNAKEPLTQVSKRYRHTPQSLHWLCDKCLEKVGI